MGKLTTAAALVLICCLALSAPASDTPGCIVHGGFTDFSRGRFDDAGSNLYVNANGIIEVIHRWDVNNDGYVDLYFANSDGRGERGFTRTFSVDPALKGGWKYKDLSGVSGWAGRVADLDNDGYDDLIVAGGDNGVSCLTPSFVYWGGPNGLGKDRTDLSAVGAYDLAVMDVNHDGRLDVVLPSSWRDRHNPGKPIFAKIYLQEKDRRFEDATDRYGVMGIGTTAAAASDLNGDGFEDLILANFRREYAFGVESFIYWGKEIGFDVDHPVRLPTDRPRKVVVADLNGDGSDDIIFTGGSTRVYWNRGGVFNVKDKYDIVTASRGTHEESYIGSVLMEALENCAVTDFDMDGQNELILSLKNEIQIRPGKDLGAVTATVPLGQAGYITAADLNSDRRADLIVSRFDNIHSHDTESVIFWNTPSGFSLENSSVVPTSGAWSSSVGDFNGDGQPELAISQIASGEITAMPSFIYLGNEKADYNEKRRLELPLEMAWEAAAADLDLDGFPDFVLCAVHDNRKIRIFPGGPKGPSPNRYTDLEGISNSANAFDVADFNRDGYLDLLVNGHKYEKTTPPTTAIFYGSQQGYSTSRRHVFDCYPWAVHDADVNKDGHLDVLLSDSNGFISIYFGSKDDFDNRNVSRVACPLASGINSADLNKDGWLDLIVCHMCHRTARQETFSIFYGSPDGFSVDNAQHCIRGYTPKGTAVADFNNDGNLDVAVTAYSSKSTRILPVTVHYGDGKKIDIDNPVELPGCSSSALVAIDFNRDGWIDLAVANHRVNASHRVDSVIYWNGPDGFSPNKATSLPTFGAHGMLRRDFGNAYTREPCESYVSPPLKLKANSTLSSIHWDAEAPPPSRLRFQLRTATTEQALGDAKWFGPQGQDSAYEISGEQVAFSGNHAHWIQYKAMFIYPYGGRSPRLRQVRMVLKPRQP